MSLENSRRQLSFEICFKLFLDDLLFFAPQYTLAFFSLSLLAKPREILLCQLPGTGQSDLNFPHYLILNLCYGYFLVSGFLQTAERLALVL